MYVIGGAARPLREEHDAVVQISRLQAWSGTVLTAPVAQRVCQRPVPITQVRERQDDTRHDNIIRCKVMIL